MFSPRAQTRRAPTAGCWRSRASGTRRARARGAPLCAVKAALRAWEKKGGGLAQDAGRAQRLTLGRFVRRRGCRGASRGARASRPRPARPRASCLRGRRRPPRTGLHFARLRSQASARRATPPRSRCAAGCHRTAAAAAARTAVTRKAPSEGPPGERPARGSWPASSTRWPGARPPPPVLTGHVSSLPRTNWICLVPSPVLTGHVCAGAAAHQARASGRKSAHAGGELRAAHVVRGDLQAGPSSPSPSVCPCCVHCDNPLVVGEI